MQNANTQDVAPLTGRIAGKPIYPAAPAGARTPAGVEALALQWFARMRTGEIDRSQLAPERIHVVKIVFPRGDAASLMMGFSGDGKITGVAVGGMAGD